MKRALKLKIDLLLRSILIIVTFFSITFIPNTGFAADTVQCGAKIDFSATPNTVTPNQVISIDAKVRSLSFFPQGAGNDQEQGYCDIFVNGGAVPSHTFYILITNKQDLVKNIPSASLLNAAPKGTFIKGSTIGLNKSDNTTQYEFGPILVSPNTPVIDISTKGSFTLYARVFAVDANSNNAVLTDAAPITITVNPPSDTNPPPTNTPPPDNTKPPEPPTTINGAKYNPTVNNICTPDESTNGYTHNVARCVNNLYLTAVAIAGFGAVFMLSYAGYLYITGGQETIQTAKSIFGSTITALAILFATYAILNTIDPNLTNINAVVLRNINCGGGDNCVIQPLAVDNNTKVTGPGPTGGDCGSCVFLKDFVGADHVADPNMKAALDLATKLQGVQSTVNWKITSAYSQAHKSSCHKVTGTCADTVATSGKPADWASLCNALKKAGLTTFNETDLISSQNVIDSCGKDHAEEEKPPKGFWTGPNVHVGDPDQ